MRRRHQDDEDTLILHEVGLCQGIARIDLVVVNGSLNGYEIKSDADHLERLPGQREVYSRALDFVTVVVSERHAQAVRRRVPRWWGIWTATRVINAIQFEQVRPPAKNPDPDPRAVVELLWREEALEELELRELATGAKSKSRAFLWDRLSNALTFDEVGDIVRRRLRLRGARWRPIHGPET